MVSRESPPLPTVSSHVDQLTVPVSPDLQGHSALTPTPEPTDPTEEQPAVIELELQDLDDLEFLLDEIEDQIAPLA